MVTISVEHLQVTLGQHRVLDDITTHFTPGRLTGIVGPNGAGKSTLARAILGLIAYEGAVTVDGVAASRLPRADLARRIAYYPQGQTLHWPLSVERLVELGRLPHIAPMQRMTERDAVAIDRAMTRAHILPLRDRIATELSGGERARVLLARALAVEAPALIADEPLASLDPGHQIDVMDLLKGEAAAGGLVIAVLHDLTMAARYCDHLLLMDQGRLVAEGTPGEVLTASNLREVYGIEAEITLTGAWPTITPLGRVRA